MAQMTRRELFPGVWLRAIHTEKFKSAYLSITLMAPLKRETAAENALVPYVLRRGTAVHPDMERLSAALDAQGRLEDFWLGQAAAGLEEEPQALAQRIAAVTKEQVVAVANKLELDTIYFLKGKEEAHG